ncbi:MAG: hypothetical protein ACE37F_00585 [Nannocystaceae bacterium]|nr:hypothetical protein [bacterium]
MSVEPLEEFVGQMTVAELCSRTGRRIDELLLFCEGGAGKGSKGPASQPVRKPSRSRTRTHKLDEQIFGVLEGASDGVGGRDLANATGATLPRVRAALKRLVAAKRVRFAGLTSARRYWAT